MTLAGISWPLLDVVAFDHGLLAQSNVSFRGTNWRDQTGMTTQRQLDRQFLHEAYLQAKESYDQGGLPIGAVMVENGIVIARGHNRRVQEDDPIAHGEMDCLRRAGRRPRYEGVTLYTTLSPCMMCAGTILQFGIRRVVVGEAENFPGNIEFLRSHNVDVHLVNDATCIALMARFIRERPDLWDEDIAGTTSV